MSQSRLGSFIETVANTFIGFVATLAAQLVIYPIFDIHISFVSNLWMTCWFTFASILRGYVLRRWFNNRLRAASERMADSLIDPKLRS